MEMLTIYLWICNKVHHISLPKIKFRNLKNHYKTIYQKDYKTNEEDVNKATFLIFFSVLIIFIPIFFLIKFDFVLISIIFFTLALSISYRFNSYLFKKVLKREIRLNAILYFIKVNFSILKESLSKDSDLILAFIKLIKSYRIQISKSFELVLIKIHEGLIPETELIRIITPSLDFNNYMKNYVLGPQISENLVLEGDYNMLERRFKVYLRQIETRMSLVFFIGVFFPLALCFLIMFYRALLYFSFIFLPFFFLLINSLFKNLIKNDGFLFGLLNNHNKLEKRKFSAFIFFLKNFAFQLQENSSPESAFLYAYSKSEAQLELLQTTFKNQINNLLSLSSTFSEMLDLLKQQMKSIRYYLILDIIKEIVKNNAFNSSKKILSILNIISTHQKLEMKLETVMKGEKFKVFMFLFLLPIIIGAIGGLFPIFTLLVENLNLTELIHSQNLIELLFSLDFLIIYFVLLTCILISSYFFLKVINSTRINTSLAFIFIIFSLLFIFSFYNAIFLL
ncbi:MAG: hypothetical protein EU542_01470 [Promethearchaeota archaeon]|nr:MAG: hypothetical protein EU542_01470 [Candidatus Lokiarchaeota archaeon]